MKNNIQQSGIRLSPTSGGTLESAERKHIRITRKNEMKTQNCTSLLRNETKRFPGVILAAFISLASFAVITAPAAADGLHTLSATSWINFKFSHPGLWSSMAELSHIKSKIVLGQEPWASNFQMLRSYARLPYTAIPYAYVYQGIGGVADHGFSQEMQDANEAYAFALMWILTGDTQYAMASAAIMDAWSSTLISQTGANWYLEAAWAGSLWPQAAELIRSTYPAWTGSVAFGKMLNNIFLPALHNRMAFGNREMTVINAMMAIGVYNNDVGAFVEGVNHYQSYVPSYYYISSDGPTPIQANYWLTTPSDYELNSLSAAAMHPGWTSWITLAAQDYNTAVLHAAGEGDDSTNLLKALATSNPSVLWGSNVGVYISGYSPETGGRDLAHAESAFGSTINAAEIAWHQNIDLYTPYAVRLTSFMETTSALRLGNLAPAAAYGGVLQGGNELTQSEEIAYDRFHNVQHLSLPQTGALIYSVLRAIPLCDYLQGLSIGSLWKYEYSIPVLFAPRVAGQSGWITSWTTLTHGDLH